jgi:hypothetical protein
VSSDTQLYIDQLRQPGLSELVIKLFLLPEPEPEVSSPVGPAPTPTNPHSSPNNAVANLAPTSPQIQALLPAAYPIIQPARAAEFFVSAAGLGNWQVHLSGRAEADLRAHRQDGKAFEVVLNTIRCARPCCMAEPSYFAKFYSVGIVGS